MPVKSIWRKSCQVIMSFYGQASILQAADRGLGIQINDLIISMPHDEIDLYTLTYA